MKVVTQYVFLQQIRALTREVGSLREELRRETKKKEIAVQKSKDDVELRLDADKLAKQLQYANKYGTNCILNCYTHCSSAT